MIRQPSGLVTIHASTQTVARVISLFSPRPRAPPRDFFFCPLTRQTPSLAEFLIPLLRVLAVSPNRPHGIPCSPFCVFRG